MAKAKPQIALFAVFLATILSPSAHAESGRLGMHSMLYPHTPYTAKQQMFAEAKEAGASIIRVDLPLFALHTKAKYHGYTIEVTNWEQADQFAELSRRYDLPLLVVLYGMPSHRSTCPADEQPINNCPPADPAQYRLMVQEIVERYKEVASHWEILNEPDEPEYFTGSPQQYAEMLEAAYQGIHEADPGGKLVLGGISNIQTTAWMDQIMQAGAARWIDVPSIHLRSSAEGTAKYTAEWRDYFTSQGILGPMWISEFGYPADPNQQWDRSYSGGELAQAQFYADTLPWVADQGAEKILVTQRDWGAGGFASEGLIDTEDPLAEYPAMRRRAAFAVFQQYARFLKAEHPPAPRGSITLSPRQGKRIKIQKGAAYIRFACPARGDCPAQSFRLRLQYGGSYLIKNPEGIKAGRETKVRFKLTKQTKRKLNKTRGGIPCRLHSLKGILLGKFMLG